MGALSEDLKEMGYSRTEKESPFDDDGMLWSNGTELVCDETAIVLRGGEVGGGDDTGDRDYFRYPNSGKVRMIGGFMSNYFDDDGFTY